MPKRRRLLTPMKKKSINAINAVKKEKEITTPRGRLKGALQDALDPLFEVELEDSPLKREKSSGDDYTKDRRYSSEDDQYSRPRSPARQSYVLKLFDRSVDLSQFEEDSPLYPICRAWILNQPKADYSRNSRKYEKPMPTEKSVVLPGPKGPPVSRIPKLLPEQEKASKDNINLNYVEAPPPERHDLLQGHLQRWTAVRTAWLEQGAKLEARYEDAQTMLNKMNVSAI